MVTKTKDKSLGRMCIKHALTRIHNLAVLMICVADKINIIYPYRIVNVNVNTEPKCSHQISIIFKLWVAPIIVPSVHIVLLLSYQEP